MARCDKLHPVASLATRRPLLELRRHLSREGRQGYNPHSEYRLQHRPSQQQDLHEFLYRSSRREDLLQTKTPLTKRTARADGFHRSFFEVSSGEVSLPQLE